MKDKQEQVLKSEVSINCYPIFLALFAKSKMKIYHENLFFLDIKQTIKKSTFIYCFFLFFNSIFIFW